MNAHKFVCVATVHRSKDEDKLRRIIQNLQVQEIQRIISSFKLRQHKFYGLSEKVGWADGHWRKYSFLDGCISEHMQSKVYVFTQFCVLVEECPDHPDAAGIWETNCITYLVEGTEYRQLHDLARDPVDCV